MFPSANCLWSKVWNQKIKVRIKYEQVGKIKKTTNKGENRGVITWMQNPKGECG